MDRTYEDEATRQAAMYSGFIPVVPPKKNRWSPWEYDKELYKRRNEIEGYFRRLKRFRKVFTRYDKLDIIFIAVISLAMENQTIKDTVGGANIRYWNNLKNW